MKKALIYNSQICEVRDEVFPVHEGLQWVDVPDDTTERDTYQNGVVVKYIPPVRTLIDLSDVDNVEKALKALGLVVAAWNGKTPGQLKVAFKTAWDSLP